jgi:hypothetical protein
MVDIVFYQLIYRCALCGERIVLPDLIAVTSISVDSLIAAITRGGVIRIPEFVGEVVHLDRTPVCLLNAYLNAHNERLEFWKEMPHLHAEGTPHEMNTHMTFLGFREIPSHNPPEELKSQIDAVLLVHKNNQR